VTNTNKGRLGSRFARLATGTKLLLILAAALLPLGLIAIFASVTSAQENNAARRGETLQRLELKAQRLNTAFSRSVLTISTASDAVSLSAKASRVCETTLARLEQSPVPARYGLFGGAGELRCGSAGFRPPAAPAHPAHGGTIARISEDERRLDLFVFGEGGKLEGVAEFDRETLHDLTYIPGTSRDFNLDLSQPGRTMVLRREFKPGRWRQQVAGTEDVAAGQLQLSILLSALPITFTDVLGILLPVLMSILAAAIGWLVADRLLLRPLVRMQRAVAAYRPGDRALDLPPVTTPAREIGELGEAFRQVIQTVARHESELEAAVERQTRLVREVHHRVKNNLQVVASLLNIHSRGSKNEDVAAAYASIQRRVDALAVVHRNHYAELEENRGVALKSLISELAANLRATAPAGAAGMTIRLDVEPYYVTQDVAVSVAFLLTEMVEYAMFCGGSTVSIAVDGGEAPASNTATLVVESESLAAGAGCDETLTERFQRIVTGLSRQLRSAIERDEEIGRYAIVIAVVAKADR
jgi:two-component sensor histidine kinase